MNTNNITALGNYLKYNYTQCLLFRFANTIRISPPSLAIITTMQKAAVQKSHVKISRPGRLERTTFTSEALCSASWAMNPGADVNCTVLHPKSCQCQQKLTALPVPRVRVQEYEWP